MKKILTYIAFGIGISLIVAGNYFLEGKVHDYFDRPEPQISATSTHGIEVRDMHSFILRPTMVQEEYIFSNYVDVLEGDTIHIIITTP